MSRPRVAILGAGCAGLTVAEQLRDHGIDDVTLFEASARPGGKIRSVPYESAPVGGRGLFEAGTVFFIPSPTWTRLLARYGVDPSVQSMPRVELADLGSGKIMSPFFYAGGHSRLRRVREVLQFLGMLERYGPAVDAEPGVAPHVTEDLSDPAATWFERQDLRFVREVLLPIAGGAQFGPLVSSVPAVYVVRLLTMLRRYPLVAQLSLRMPQLRVGHERLWAEVAKRHDVRYVEPVTRLSRSDGVRVETPKGTYRFDKVVVAMPPEQYAAIDQDLTSSERTVFEAVRSLDRVIVTARVAGLGSPAFYVPRYLDDGTVPPGHPYLFYEVDPKSGLYTFHPYLDGGVSIEQAERAVRTLVERLGGRVDEIVHRRVVKGWFPHFDASALRDGAYTKLEAMQGARDTYFVGELFSGVGVPHVTEYAAKVADRLAQDAGAETRSPDTSFLQQRWRDGFAVASLLVAAIAVILATHTMTLLCFALLAVLAGVSAMVWRTRSDRILCATGLVFGPSAEACATTAGLWRYEHTDVGTLPLWIAPMWWMYPIAVTRLVHAVLGVGSPSHPAALSLVSMASLVAWLCTFGRDQPFVALAGALAVLAVLLRRGFGRAEMGTLVVGGFIGPVAELLPVTLGAWRYPGGGPLGLPIWLLPGYGAFGLALVRLGVRLGELHRPARATVGATSG